jgi:PST family polysaccharide transporter
MKKFQYIFVIPSISDILAVLKGGWYIFISTLAINMYTSTNVVILGLLTNNSVVGYFSAANKLVDCVKGVMNAVTQAVYPNVSQRMKKSKQIAVCFLGKFLKYYVGSCTCLSMILFIGAEVIVNLLFGPRYEETITVLRLMSVLPLIISISNVYGIQLMLNWGCQKIFSLILFSAAILNLIIVVPLTYVLSDVGVSVTMVVVELFISAATVLYVNKIMKISLVMNL